MFSCLEVQFSLQQENNQTQTPDPGQTNSMFEIIIADKEMRASHADSIMLMQYRAVEHKTRFGEEFSTFDTKLTVMMARPR